jgi:hypothetical protein
VILDECAVTIAGRRYVAAMLDVGPESVDGWFARLVAAELGIATSSLLDFGARELDREDILADVWGDNANVASNVVDVVVRSLRKKLGERADVIETISGIGYRLREEATATTNA